MQITYTTDSGFLLHAELKHSLCVFEGSSGIGKTYFFKLLKCYCLEKDLPFFMFNSSTVGTSVNNISKVKPGTIIVLDDAEAYETKDLIQDYLQAGCLVLVSTHYMLDVGLSVKPGYYSADFDNNRIEVTENEYFSC